MMDAEGANATLLGRLFGPDNGTVLSFTYSVDNVNETFSYSSMPGSTYLGQPFSLSASGDFNSTSGLWEMSASGALGSTSLNGTGSGSVTDPPPIPTGTYSWLWGLLDYHASVSYSAVFSSVESTASAGLSIAGTDVATFSGTDLQKFGQGWTWTAGQIQIGGFNFDILSAGNDPAGTFTTQITTVPEPTALNLISIGALSLLGNKWRRRTAKA
jgi:hypothetical protein